MTLEPPKEQSPAVKPETISSKDEAGTSTKPETSAEMSKRTQMIVIGAAVLFLVLLIAAIVLMAKFPGATQVVRDIAIVFVAVETFIIGLAMIVLIFQVQMLIQMLRDEIEPLLLSVNDTASTVRGTTEFVSHNVVNPFIQMAGFAAGARKVVSDLANVVGAMRPNTRSTPVSKEGGGNSHVETGK